MTNYANRGMAFEELIQYTNARYRNSGLAIVEKIPTEFIPIRNRCGKVINCKVDRKAPVDFMGRYLNTPVAIEAKHTSTDRIRFAEVQDHQAKFLNDFSGEYGLGFSAVLVSFKMERFFLVPWYFWASARDMWKRDRGEKAGVVKYGMSWTTPGKASVSADELLPEWEIHKNHRYGLDYGENIRKYISPVTNKLG